MKRTLSLTPQSVTRFLLTVVGALLLVGLLRNYLHFVLGVEHALGFIQLFDLNGELTLPALYSALAIWLSAGLLWIIYKDEKNKGHQQAHCWKVLFFVFVYLGVDELAAIHESFDRFAPYIRERFPALAIIRNWVIPFTPLLVLFVLFFYRFFWELPKMARQRLALSAAVYLGGAIGVEIVGLWYDDPSRYSRFLQSLFVLVEEGLEMGGIVLFIRALVLYLEGGGRMPRVSFELVGEGGAKEKVEVKKQAKVTVITTGTTIVPHLTTECVV